MIQAVESERAKPANGEKGGDRMRKVDTSSVTEALYKMVQKDERMLDRFQGRLIQAQFIDRPKLRLLRAAQGHIQWYSDQLMLLREELLKVEQAYGGGVQLWRTEERDIRHICQWSNRIQTRKLLRQPVRSLQEWTLDIHRWSADDDAYPFSIDRRANGEHIGFLILRRLGRSWEKRVGELYFVIIDDGYQERGYGTEAVRTVLNMAFDELEVDMVYLWTQADNNAAIRCFEKNGFKFTDIERDKVAYNGEKYDRFRMEIKKGDWQQLS